MSQAVLASGSYGEDGYSAWLRYMPMPPAAVGRGFLPVAITTLGADSCLAAAAREIRFGIELMLGLRLIAKAGISKSSFILGTVASLEEAGFICPQSNELKPDGFQIAELKSSAETHVVISGITTRGVLYGAFALLRHLSLEPSDQSWALIENPSAPIRFLNHWDNPGGTIERGYAGRSIFFTDAPDTEGLVTQDLPRVTDYARLLASVGINGCSLNNVNADDRVYTAKGLEEMKRLADAMRPCGVQALLSIALDSPQRLGGLASFDPLDPSVSAWWRAKVKEIYESIPDLAGLLIKADSEGSKGPSACGRTHADAANVVARAIKPFGGVMFYRGFVYDHRMDWRDLTNDRAKAAYDNFKSLDGAFDDNVIVQVKNGPIDFQVREPASPTFAALERTNTVIELMITQEYLGQQRHTVYEVPWWKDTLEFDMEIDGRLSRVQDIVTGTTFKPAHFGFVAVCGVGRDRNWLGNHLAQANLYGYGRLAWNPDLSSEEIADEWTALTLSRDPEVRAEVGHILMRSWPVYEMYTGNLGIGGLTDIIHVHYGPAPLSSEHNGWGQWHRSLPTGTGMDRTSRTGTGFAAQYPPKAAAMFEDLAKCPDELLLFFHHVPYTHRIRSGTSVIQHIYDSHYEGATEVAGFVQRWARLEGRIDIQRHRQVLAQLKYQASHAVVWRDSICSWFERLSGIADERGRVGAHPHRVEAEDMSLQGYLVTAVEPWEAASGSTAVALPHDSEEGEVSFVFAGSDGIYDIHVWYFDVLGGSASYFLTIGKVEIDSWVGNGGFPSEKLDAHTRTRRVAWSVELHTGDTMRVRGRRDGADAAAIDCVDIQPSDVTSADAQFGAKTQ